MDLQFRFIFYSLCGCWVLVRQWGRVVSARMLVIRAFVAVSYRFHIPSSTVETPSMSKEQAGRNYTIFPELVSGKVTIGPNGTRSHERQKPTSS